MEIPQSTLDRFKVASDLTTKVVKIQYASDVLKLDMKEFFNPKNKTDDALLFGAFAKYHHGKIQDAFLTCQKGFLHSKEEKYRSITYLIGIIRNLK